MLKRLSITAAGLALVLAIGSAVLLSYFPAHAQIVTAYLLRTNNGSDILNTATFRTNLGAAKSGAVTGSGLTQATARLLGRTTSGTGAIEEIAVSGCTLSSGTLTCSGSGTVTSVALALPSSILTVSGSPVTGSGTLTGTLAPQSANLVWAGPSTGSAAAPTFRTLTLAGADFVNQGTTATVLHGNASGNPSWAAVSLTADVSGVLPAANGGVGSAVGITPSVKFAGGNTGITYSTQSAAYTSNGSAVTVSFYIVLSSKGSSTGQFSLVLTGAPTISGITANNGSGCYMNYYAGTQALTGDPTANADSGTVQFDFYQFASTGKTAVTDTNITNSTQIRGVCYYTK